MNAGSDYDSLAKWLASLARICAFPFLTKIVAGMFCHVPPV